jgi:Flp pilus assembly protein TadG
MRDERGSAVIESIFAIVVLLVLALGAIQVALTLYARNVVQAAVHDGSRALVEIGNHGGRADAIVREVVGRSAGALVDDLRVETSIERTPDRLLVHVRAGGVLTAPGPIPIDLPITVDSSSGRELIDVGP